MKTNFKKFMAMLLAVLMVASVFSTLATAVGTATSDVCPVSGGAHNWVQYGSDEEAIVPPTCTTDGYTWIICDDCKKVDIKDIKFATGHTASDWIVDVQASCERNGREGKRHIECEVCEVILAEEVIPALAEHNFEWQEDNPEAKCGENHRVYLHCVNPGSNKEGICGFVYEHRDEIKKHNYAAYSVLREPTCYEYGIMRYTCTQTYVENGETKTCDAYVDVKIEKLEHTLVEHEGKAPTCTEDGYADYYTCAVEKCGYTTFEVVPATGHKYESVVTDPTCTEGGYTTYTCPACGDSYVDNETEATGHDMGDWYETTAPSCEGEGTQRSDCKNCDYYETDSVDAVGHKYDAVVTDPTCTEGGYTTYTCSVCGDSYVDDETEATGHDYEGEVTPPTCSKEGYTTYTCQNGCGDSYVDDTVPAAGCEWSEWRVVSHGDCNSEAILERVCLNPECDGVGRELDYGEFGDHPTPPAYEEYVDTKGDDIHGEHTNSSYLNNQCMVRYTCSECGEVISFADPNGHRQLKTQIVIEASTCDKAGRYADHCLECDYWFFYEKPALNHENTIVKVDAKAPTCTEPGHEAYEYCTECAYTTFDEIPALGHNYQIVDTLDPTCTEDGLETWACQNGCGEGYEVPIDKLGHNYIPDVTDPTCEDRGYTTYTCSVCNDSYADDYTDALGHKHVMVDSLDPTCEESGWEKWACERCDDDFTEELDPLGHTPGAAATCTEPQVCTVCGEVLVEALGHTPNIPEATCTQDQICTVCGEILEESGENKHPVDQSYYVPTNYPTCTVGGTATVFCDMCHAIDKPVVWDEANTDELSDYLYDRLSPLGHDIDPTVDEPTSIIYQTCVEDGLKTWTCGRCGVDVHTEVIPADGVSHPENLHGFHEEAYFMEYNGVMMGWARTPSCSANGLAWYYCEACAAADTTGRYNGYTVTIEDSMNTACHDLEDYENCNLLLNAEKSVFADCYNGGFNYYECTCTHWVVFEVKDDDGNYFFKTEERACSYYYIEYTDPAGHEWNDDDWFVDIPADCESDGLEKRICWNCEEEETRTIEATGHDWHVHETIAPDCENDGYTLYICYNNRKHTKQDDLKATGHDWVFYDSEAATCEEWGYNWYMCTICKANESRKELEPLDHKYDSVVTDPTCTDQGYTTHTCERDPSHTYVDSYTDALGHNYIPVVTDPTCEDRGYTTYTCSRCGDSYVDDYTKALGHYLEVYSHTDPTCEKPGSTFELCSRCKLFGRTTHHEPLGHEYEADVTDPTCTDGGYTTYVCKNDPTHTYVDDYTDALGHDYVEIDRVDPTCISEGSVTYKCSRCDDSYTDVLKKTAHNPYWANEYYQCIDHMKAPTCDEDGIGWGSYCQNFYGTEDQHCADNHETIPAYGHHYETDKVEAGCENFGFTYTICRHCGDGYGVATNKYPEGMLFDEEGNPIEGIITDYVPALGHDWVQNVAKDPTCTEDGYYYDDCSRCDEIVVGETIPATGHKAPNHYIVDEEGNPVLDEDGKIQYCPAEYDCENGCGTIISGHRDDEGNDMFEYREEVVCELDILADGTANCKKTHYEIAYCVECGYKEVLKIWISKDTDHDMIIDEDQSYEATETTPGKTVWVCDNDCGYTYEENYAPSLDDKVVFDGDIYGCDENGNKRGSGKIVNGGYMALKLKVSAFDANIWGISFDLAFDNEKLVFEHALTAKANKTNGFVNDFNSPATTADMAIVRVMSTYERGNGLQNWNFTGTDYEYITLIFAVKSTAYETDAVSILGEDFSFVRTEVIDNEKNDSADDIIFNEIGDLVIWKAANLDDVAALGLGDANDLMVLATSRGYDERADINWDGKIDSKDFRAMKKILMNDGLVDGYYEAILDGEIVA